MGLPMSSVSMQRQLVAMRAQQFGEAQQHLLALARRAARPVAALEERARLLATARSTSAASAGGDLRDHAPVDGADAVEGGARGRGDENARR